MVNNFKFILEYNDYIKNIEKSTNDNYIYNEIIKRTKFGKLAISEGLIFTHPIDKSINILKRRFPELNIEVESDGEIYIENTIKQKLNVYLPIITNLGYFISLYTIDGSKWIKTYDEDTEALAFYLEPKYDIQVNVPDVLYHASPIKYKDKISKIGFIPKTGNKLSNHPDRIYLTDNIDVAYYFGKSFNDGYCIYKINGKCIDKLYSDINLRQGGYYTLQNIKPNCFELIKEII